MTKKAKSRGSNLSAEVRKAVDAFLAGVTLDDLRMLDAATLKAKQEIGEINRILDQANARADKFFREIEAIKNETPKWRRPI